MLHLAHLLQVQTVQGAWQPGRWLGVEGPGWLIGGALLLRLQHPSHGHHPQNHPATTCPSNHPPSHQQAQLLLLPLPLLPLLRMLTGRQLELGPGLGVVGTLQACL